MVLPYNYPPIIDVYSGVAGNVAAMTLSEKNRNMILRNHFILTYYESLKAPGFNWLYYDDSYKEERDIRDELAAGDLLEYIFDCLDKGYYVQLYLDHFYLPCSSKYNKWHFVHDKATIFGYDKEKKLFYVGDNFAAGKFTIEEVVFENLVEARRPLMPAPASVFRINEDYGDVSRESIFLALKGYYESKCLFDESMINPVNVTLDGGKKVVFGMDFYDFLQNQIEECNDETYDVRTFHIFYNHMKLYDYAIDLVEENMLQDDIVKIRDEAKQLEEDSLKLRNMYIKYNISKNKKEHVLEMLFSIKQREMKLLDSILKSWNC